MHRKSVDQLVRKDYSGRNIVLRGVMCRYAARVLPGPDILNHVIEGGREVGRLFFRPIVHTLRQVAASRALFQHNKRAWSLQLLPHALQLASHASSKQSGEISTGKII